MADRRQGDVAVRCLVLYLAVHSATMAYFVPEQERLIANAGSVPRADLKSRADRWMFLNYFRNLAGVLAFVFLLRAFLSL